MRMMVNLFVMCPMKPITQSDCNNMNYDLDQSRRMTENDNILDQSHRATSVKNDDSPDHHNSVTQRERWEHHSNDSRDMNIYLAWPINSWEHSQPKHSTAATCSHDDSITVDENKDAHLSNSVFSSCADLLLPHKGVGTLPNLGRAPLNTLFRCAVFEVKCYTNFLGVLLPLFGFGEPHPSHTWMTLSWR